VFRTACRQLATWQEDVLVGPSSVTTPRSAGPPPRRAPAPGS
jgi:hypothetical protein